MDANRPVAPAALPVAPARSWWGLTATLGPVLMVAMDGSILFLAMPHINAAIRPTTEQSLWVLDIYGFVVGALLVTFGNIGDRFGRKKLLLIGATVFGLGSLAGALAPTPEALIAARVLMGLGGATLLPSCLAVISELFQNPAQRARAIGIFAATFAAGFVIGPILGGVMLNHFWWGSVFLINIPVIVLFLGVAPVVLTEVHGSRPGRIDVPSVLLSASGLAMAIYGMKHAAAAGLDGRSGGLIVVGVLVLTVFVRRQRRLAHPLVDIGLFRERVFSVAILTGLLSLFVWSAAAYLSMTYLQSVLGYPVGTAALLAVPGAIVLMASCILTPRLVERIGARTALVVCNMSIAGGMLLLVLAGDHGPRGAVTYLAATAISGIGFGISFSLVADTAVGAVPESRAGAAGAVAEMSNEIGNALGIAVLGSVLTMVFRAGYHGPETGIGEVIDGYGVASAEFRRATSAFLSGFHVVAVVSAVLCVGLGILALRWIPARTPKPEIPPPPVYPATARTVGPHHLSATESELAHGDTPRVLPS